MRLVGQDRQLQATGCQGIQHRTYAAIKPGLYVPVPTVIRTVRIEAGTNSLGIPLIFGERPFNELGHAIADKKAVGVNRMNGKPPGGQHTINGVADILQGVEQRPVKVKNHGPVGLKSHRHFS